MGPTTLPHAATNASIATIGRMPDGPNPSACRRDSIDAVRGFAIVGMLAANVGNAVTRAVPGGQTYSTLLHAEWLGATFADLVFPLFLFVVGVAMAWSTPRGPDASVAWGRLVRRAGLLVLFGLGIDVFESLGANEIHVNPIGTLQRIAGVVVLAVPLYVWLPARRRVITAAALLGCYAIAITLLPFPGVGPADLHVPDLNFSAWLDLQILGEGVMRPNAEGIPESRQGLLAFFSAVAYPLVGSVVGEHLRSNADEPRAAAGWLALAGVTFVAAGLLLSPLHPICRPLWSSTFVLFTSGTSLLVVAGGVAIVDATGRRDLSVCVLVTYGRNALAAYVIHVLATAIVVVGLPNLFARLAPALTPEGASLVMVAIALAIIYVPVRLMECRGVFWRA